MTRNAIVGIRFINELVKTDATAAPASIASIGYMNPVYSKPMKLPKEKRKKFLMG